MFASHFSLRSLGHTLVSEKKEEAVFRRSHLSPHPLSLSARLYYDVCLAAASTYPPGSDAAPRSLLVAHLKSFLIASSDYQHTLIIL